MKPTLAHRIGRRARRSAKKAAWESALLLTACREYAETLKDLSRLPEVVRGAALARNWSAMTNGHGLNGSNGHEHANPLKQYFDANNEGPGIWKWEHYFDIYHRHFQRFVGKDVNVLEIGIYSGGSLRMWKEYFGPGCRVFGVDIEPACKVYQDDGIDVLIGDQSDRQFWRRARSCLPPIDILIDDGGHQSDQQIITLEEMLPYMSPGSVYLCEDIHRSHNRFAAYINGLSNELNAYHKIGAQGSLSSHNSRFQMDVHSIHIYPFAVVIEKAQQPVEKLVSPRHGTEWQPFL
jgi:hypothetical protein